jgi:hypothetical protein
MSKPVDRYAAENALRALDIARANAYCRPLSCGLQSSERAVAARLSRLLTSLDNEITGNVCEGAIIACVSALKRDMLLSLRSEGWRVDYLDGKERWRVLPPLRKRTRE